MDDLAAKRVFVVGTSSSDVEVWVYAIYEQDGCIRLERSAGQIDGSTSLESLITWAKEFEDENLQLHGIEITVKNLNR